MRKYLWSIIVSILLALFACQSESKLSDDQKAAIATEVKKQYSDAISNLSKLDMNLWSEPWSDEAFISVNSGVNYFATLSQFKDSVTFWFSLRERQQVQIVDTKVSVFTSELVLLTSITNWDILLKNGEQMNAKALASLLWNKEKNGWKIIHLHESWR